MPAISNKRGNSEKGRGGFFAVLLPLCVSVIVSASWPATSGAETPLVNVVNKVQSVRAEALGGSGVAVSDDLSMLWVTPVAAAALAKGSLCVGTERGSFGETTGQILAGFPAEGMYVYGGGGLYDTGRITLNASDGSTREVTGQSDVVGLIGFAGVSDEGVRRGIQLKVFSSELLEEFKATSVVVDLGAQVDWTEFVTAGCALTNFGTTMKYDSESINQPVTARAGLAFRPPLGERKRFAVEAPTSLLVNLDLEYSPSRYSVALCTGAELTVGETLILRGGGRFGSVERIGNLAAGIGIRVKQEGEEYTRHYRLDYTLRLLTDRFKTPHAVSLTCVF